MFLHFTTKNAGAVLAIDTDESRVWQAQKNFLLLNLLLLFIPMAKIEEIFL